jgi:hypothetical protein
MPNSVRRLRQIYALLVVLISWPALTTAEEVTPRRGVIDMAFGGMTYYRGLLPEGDVMFAGTIAAMPYLACDLLLMILLLAVPAVALFLPGLI